MRAHWGGEENERIREEREHMKGSEGAVVVALHRHPLMNVKSDFKVVPERMSAIMQEEGTGVELQEG